METRHRAALALVALGPERAARMLRRLPEDEAIALSQEVSRIGSIDANTARDVLAELAGSLKKSTTVASGGPDYAQDILARAFGDEVAQRRAKADGGAHHEYFDYIENGRTAEIVRMLDTEPRPAIGR